jgi:hypothetical protein
LKQWDKSLLDCRYGTWLSIGRQGVRNKAFQSRTK